MHHGNFLLQTDLTGLRRLNNLRFFDFRFTNYAFTDEHQSLNEMKEELKDRTKAFGISSWRSCQTLPTEFIDYKRQLVRSSSSVGANYRAACRAKSTKDFINKLKIVEEELDESLFFIEVITELSGEEGEKWKSIYEEESQLLAIIVKSLTTIRKNNKTINRKL